MPVPASCSSLNALTMRNDSPEPGADTTPGAIWPNTSTTSAVSSTDTSMPRGLSAAGTVEVLSERVPTRPAISSAKVSSTLVPGAVGPGAAVLVDGLVPAASPGPTALATAAQTAPAAGYCSTAGTFGSRAVSTAAAAVASICVPPAAATSLPPAPVRSA